MCCFVLLEFDLYIIVFNIKYYLKLKIVIQYLILYIAYRIL